MNAFSSSSRNDPSVRVFCQIEATHASVSIESSIGASYIRVAPDIHGSSNPCRSRPISDSGQNSDNNSCYSLRANGNFDHLGLHPEHCLKSEDECKQDGDAPKLVACSSMPWRPRCMMERTSIVEIASTCGSLSCASQTEIATVADNSGSTPWRARCLMECTSSRETASTTESISRESSIDVSTTTARSSTPWRPRCTMERTSSAETASTSAGTSICGSLFRTSSIETAISTSKKVDLYIDEEGRVEVIEIERFDHPMFLDYFSLRDDCRRAALRANLQDALGRLQQPSLVTRDAKSLACLKALQSESTSAADLQYALRRLEQRHLAAYDAQTPTFSKAAQPESTSGRCKQSADFDKYRHGCKLSRSRFKDFRPNQRLVVRCH